MNELKNQTRFNATSVISEEDRIYLATPVSKPKKAKESAVEQLEQEQVTVEAAQTTEVVAEKTAYTSKKHFKLSLKGKKALSGWLFCLPFVLGIIGIYIPIVIKSIEVGLHGAKGNETAFSFATYKFVFIDDGQFLTTIVDATKDLIIQIPAIVIFALFMAILLNQKMTGRAFFRAIFFLPVILSTGVIDAIDAGVTAADQFENAGGSIDNGDGGGSFVSALDIEMLLSSVNLKFTLGTKTIDLVEIVTSLVDNIFNIVSRSGVQMLIFLSGLQSISPSIYESCQVEGATAWETFWKITLPMISPMILVNAIYTVVDLFTAADNRVMEGLKGFGGLFRDNVGYHSAAIWAYVAMVLVVIVAVALIMKAFVFYQRKD